MALRAFTAVAVVLVSIAVGALAQSAKTTTATRTVDLLTRTEDIPRLLSAGEIKPEQIPNPHWREDACLSCHRTVPTAGDVALRGRGVNELCQSCHDGISANNYIHAVGMKPSAEKTSRMPDAFRQAVERGGGVVTCISCHDLHMQCKKERFVEKSDNRLFFRSGPYMKRTDLCFNCHDPKYYERLNPHDQISDEGELNQTVCLVCHSVAPNRREVRSIADVTFAVTDDLTQLCSGCHKWRPHPAMPMEMKSEGLNHLVKPSPEVVMQMKATEQNDNLILPLEPESGRIVCATCHNPHERGVQRDPRADVGADSVNRLRRQPGKLVCMSCHNI